MNRVELFIEQNWDKAIKTATEDNGTLLGLPFPFSTPCVSGVFQELFYWDTYFTNVGLLASGRIEQAKNNIEDMFYLIDRFGWMPNGSRTYYQNRSQPPFLSQMVMELWRHTKDNAWLKERAYPALAKEYAYWQTRRMAPTGLNHYAGTDPDEATLKEYGEMLCERFDIPVPENVEILHSYGQAMLAVAESGWDCTSRFRTEGHLFNPIDQNSLLYLMEANMEQFAIELGMGGDVALWHSRKLERKARMENLMWNEDLGYYCDYQFEKGKQNDLLSLATFYPLYAGMCDEHHAEKIIAQLPRMETAYGVACCENRDDLAGLQWDYPNGWACLQYITVQALLRYGHKEDAYRLAGKFVNMIDRNYEQTGNLWEKYNICTGEPSVSKEYETYPMMGWTAGIYVAFRKLL